jgi:hypothetical protein
MQIIDVRSEKYSEHLNSVYVNNTENSALLFVTQGIKEYVFAFEMSRSFTVHEQRNFIYSIGKYGLA